MATTNVDTSLPEMDYGPGWTITVTSSDAATVISKLNVYGLTPARPTPPDLNVIPPLLTWRT
jgi:hypothetical protein